MLTPPTWRIGNGSGRRPWRHKAMNGRAALNGPSYLSPFRSSGPGPTGFNSVNDIAIRYRIYDIDEDRRFSLAHEYLTVEDSDYFADEVRMALPR
ncbi:Hypothetical protein NTJ_06325 [Nesidiocoris tenuis]|uniref:Uncharacterized protein n=1 Tax=Nesidiocoris tenuis TaxID=355587 RepID=A0ABN7AMR9_9HEMI|nr:Hypothetical protein NTJ_06325 [Nesidiocoris tenuis]